MSTHRVHAADRLTLRATTAHTAGDLVWCKGFYGTVQDDVVSGDLFTLILGDAWILKNVPSTLRAGAVLSAPATEQATTLPILTWTTHPSLNTVATTGWHPIGKTIATGTATTAKVQLFNPNPLNIS